MTQPLIGFLGAGNMATALVGGLRARGWPADRLMLADAFPAALQPHTQQGLVTTEDNRVLAEAAAVWVLAVKPQVMASVLKPLAAICQARRPLVISIAAGLDSALLCDWLGGPVPLVRAMPNTPALVQTGATGLFANDQVSAAQRACAEQILGSVGITLWLESEALIDAVTAVSGSGPAYFFYLMEAMMAAGEAQGLTAAEARALTLQTALGAAQMAITSDVDPAELRRRVTSPGGTTEQALRVFQEAGWSSLVAKALRACADQGRALAAAWRSEGQSRSAS